jgi:hypothetical protein
VFVRGFTACRFFGLHLLVGQFIAFNASAPAVQRIVSEYLFLPRCFRNRLTACMILRVKCWLEPRSLRSDQNAFMVACSGGPR